MWQVFAQQVETALSGGGAVMKTRMLPIFTAVATILMTTGVALAARVPVTPAPAPAVPEPATIALVAIGLGGLAASRMRRRK